MNVAAWIARRLRIGKGGSRSTRTGAVIAVAGVAIAVAVMEFTLAIVSGFRNEIRAKVLGFDAEISVTPAYNPETGSTDEYITIDESLEQLLSSAFPDMIVAISMTRPAVVKTDSDFVALYFTGFDADTHDYAFERSCVMDGKWPDFGNDSTANDIVLSNATASRLGLSVGDRPMLYFVGSDNASGIRARRARIAAIYNSSMEERDRALAYASLHMLQRVGGVDKSTGTAIELRGCGVDSAAARADRLQNVLAEKWQTGQLENLYPVDNVARSGAIYLNWLDLLDTNVVVIFILMLLVAASTLIAALFILVLDHIATIGLLRSIGANRTMVRSIFVAASLRLVLRGMIIGNILGLSLLLIQKYTSAVPLDAEMYYLDHVPVSINWLHMIILNAGIMASAWLILAVPSRIASRVDPARTMRYE
ncbi:MAG: FtsX-like permease family protein [Muribaculaceae bacterium]|nr:FtsX-like permease family protein [Muribaculaceae bacterium]